MEISKLSNLDYKYKTNCSFSFSPSTNNRNPNMAFFDFLTKKKINTLLPNIPFDTSVAIQRGIVTWQGGDSRAFVRDGYIANDIVYSIVKLITDKAKLAPFHVYKVKDEMSAKRYKSLMKQPDKITNWQEVNDLHKKAFEIYTGDQRLNDLLKYPNDTNLEESMARNQKRPTDKIVPRIAYNLYKKNFEEPNENEGCEVIKIE
jgi:hypothetical protein